MSIQIHNLSPQSIALDSISCGDQTYLLRYGRSPSADLEQSLRRTGMHNPPLLAPSGDGLVVVTGFERVRHWRSLGKTHIEARLATHDATQEDLLLAAIEDNLSGRGFNPIERALALDKLRTEVEPRRLIQEILPLLGLKPSEAVLERHLSLLALGSRFKEALAQGEFDEGVVELLKPFSTEEREMAVRTMLDLRMSAGARRDFARQSLEICRRDEIKLETLLSELAHPAQESTSSCSAAETDIPTQRVRLLEKLRRRRQPILSALEAQFASSHASLGLSAKVKIHPPKDFEGRQFRLEARLENVQELRAIIDSLSASLENHSGTLQDMLEVRYPE